MAKKAKIKVVDRAMAKKQIYSAMFNEKQIAVPAAAFFADWEGFNEVQKGLIFNGLTQKLNDSHAGAESSAEAYEWTSDVLANLQAGKWSVRVPGEGGPRGGNFYRAIAEWKGITEEQARDIIAEKVLDYVDDDTTEKKAFAMVKAAILKKYPQVQEILNRMQAEKIEKTSTVEVDL